ncbi:MAG: hypothetical protein LBH01_03940 [Verrucomicrobiales bacterium]|jgi:predicted  nucleic acid-binding Zn-ribbon protein|nr:hypothetical protein [Verrucomicrobiales bacterium]
MKKIIGKLLAAPLLGAALSANAWAGGWTSVSGTGQAASDGLLLVTSNWNTTLTGAISTDGSTYTQRFEVSKRDEYGQGYTSATMPVCKDEYWKITGAKSVWFFKLEGSDGADGLDGQVAVIETAVNDLEREIDRIQDDINAIGGGLDAINGNLAGLGNDLASIRSELITYGDTLVWLQQQLSDLQNQEQSHVADLQEKIDALTVTMDGLRDEVNGQIVALTKRLDGFDSRLTDLEQKVATQGSGKQSSSDWWGKAGAGLGVAGVGIAVGHLVSDEDNADEKEPAEGCGAPVPAAHTRPGYQEATGN